MLLFRNSILLILGLSALAAGPVFALDWRQVSVGSVRFRVEIAQTTQEREQGLMYRRELPPDQGMLFIQPPNRVIFWMKNTLIPSDILYFDTNGWLSQIEASARPCITPTCPFYPSDRDDIRYVLEINAGEAARRGIRVGDRLQLEE